MPNTMAEAFCEEYLITWTEHGEDFTDWRDGDIFTRSNRMSRGRRHQPVPSATGGPPADRHRVPGPVVDRPTGTPRRRPAHRGNQRGRTPHPGPHPPDAGGRAVLVYGDGSKVSDTTFGPNCSSRMSKRPRLEPSLSSASNILFHLPPQGLIDTGPKAQNGVGLKVT